LDAHPCSSLTAEAPPVPVDLAAPAPLLDDRSMQTTSAPEMYLDWLDLGAAPGYADVTGRFGMTILPGRRCSGKTAKEPRDLERDAAALASLGIDAFILLVEDHELPEQPHTGHVVPAPGDLAAFGALVEEVDGRLRAGQTLGISCHGGLGRTGILAACLLKRAGLEADAAISAVRRSRPGTVETAGQEAFGRAW
jgi:hypothetical protein